MATDALPTEAHTREARAWLADCVWADADADDIMDAPAGAIWRAVRRHYEGGQVAFLTSCQGL